MTVVSFAHDGQRSYCVLDGVQMRDVRSRLPNGWISKHPLLFSRYADTQVGNDARVLEQRIVTLIDTAKGMKSRGERE